MMESVSSHDSAVAGQTTRVCVELFEPPMCCSTGLCGPSVDKTLLDLNDMLLVLQREGVDVRRYQMSTQPQAFLGNPRVYQLVRERQMAALPITAVNGRVIKIGAYPTLVEVRNALRDRSL